MNFIESNVPRVRRLRMAAASSCTEGQVATLVYEFYARVRADALLGPVFDAHIVNWETHLLRMVDFWSSVLRRSGRFSGSPMTRHAVLPDLDETLFQRWLELFRQTAQEQSNTLMAGQAVQAAQRIAQSLWQGYQLANAPDVPARALDESGWTA